MFTIDTALKQLDVTEKQVRRIRAELPRLNREKVDKEMKLSTSFLRTAQMPTVSRQAPLRSCVSTDFQKVALQHSARRLAFRCIIA